MENTPPQPYHDSSASSRSPSPTWNASTPSSDSSVTIKPLPALPVEAPTHLEEPYRDDPPTPTDTTPPASHDSSPTYTRIHPAQPYTDSPPPTPDNDENIPLAHFLLNPYPHESPPSYSVAVRQSHSYRDTLIQYIPNTEHTEQLHISHHRQTSSVHYTPRRPLVIEIDEETGEVLSRTDDVRHSVEKVVAMFVVAAALLILSGMLAWLALGNGWFES